MPIYEYRCPEAHTFELFQRMTDAPPAACEICGASPVSKVLYPAAIHFKGSGFYSTDYARDRRRRDGREGEAVPAEAKSDESKSESKSEKKPEKKATEA